LGGKIDIKNIIFVFSILFFTKKNLGGGVGDDELNNRRRELN
jgi:hypothetical protein